MNEESLSLAENLKLICLTATGTNNVDFSYTNKRGIAVANVKGYSTQSVIQHTFALFFYLYEKLSYYDRFVKSGDYSRNDIFSHFDAKFNELCGKTWGIIGYGAIGKKVGMEVIDLQNVAVIVHFGQVLFFVALTVFVSLKALHYLIVFAGDLSYFFSRKVIFILCLQKETKNN
jgi:lactate dehydrogenase-like 2-hydroxyacid dehydrogenase